MGLEVFAGLTGVIDRHTDSQRDHATLSVTAGRICVRSTVMRPKNTLSYSLALYSDCYLWSPYVIGQTIIFSCCGLFFFFFFFMVALWNRETIYIFMLWFVLLLLSFFLFLA